MTTFLKAVLEDGTEVVSEFAKLEGSGQRYIGQVFAGQKPFNAWRVVGSVHPITGEPALVRSRVMLNGSQITRVTQVKPVAGREEDHGYAPDAFEPVTEVQSGEFGTWVCPSEGAPEGAVVGASYPVHRDPASMERFVYLTYATDRETHEGEVRYLLDQGRVVLGGDPIEALMGGPTATEDGEGGNVGVWVDEDDEDRLLDADDDL
jgi:hypothetical protein